MTAANNTTVYVDYNGDRAGPLTDPRGDKYDVATNLVALQSVRLYDPDKDQTAMRIYTLDGTLITGAWGQDPAVAGAGNPFLDMGTTVLPFPQAVIRKTSTIYTDNPPSGLSTNDVLEYTINIDNNSVVVLGNVIFLDAPPPSLSYVANSSLHDGVAVTDNTAPATLFPFDEGGYVIPVIPRGSSIVLKYRARILAGGSIINTAGQDDLTVTNIVVVPGPTGSTPCVLDFTDGGGTVVASYAAGSGIYATLRDADANTSTTTVNTISVTVQNPSSGDLETITLTELNANTNVFRNLSALPSSPTAGVGQQDGTLFLAPGQTLSVTYTDPVFGDVCSDGAVISTPSATKVLYLSTDGSGSPDQDLDRIDPVATADAITATSVVLVAGSGAISVGNVTTGAVNEGAVALTNLAVAHVTGVNGNRLMLVGVSFEDDNTAGLSVTNVRYVVGTATQSLTRLVQRASSQEAASEIWRLVAPNSGTGTVTVFVSDTMANDGDAIVVGVTTLSGVDQTTPFRSTNSNTGTTTPASLVVTSAVGELVFDTLGLDDARAATVAAGQTQRWSAIAGTTDTDGIRGAGSTKAGSNTVTMSYTFTSDAWVLCGLSIKPASAGTNRTTFTQTPTLCDTLALPAGGTITITNHLLVTSGTVPTNPAITARLLNGNSVIASITNPVFNTSTSNLVWTAVLPAATNIPSGSAITFEVTSSESGASFAILYDSSSRPSKIGLPTTTIIDISSLGVYNAPYPGGSLVSVANNGNTLYARATVTDPFGAYDITSLGLVIDGAGTLSDVSITLTNNSVVASNSCSKTYEYVWVTGSTEGSYTIAATANEGSEGITDTTATAVNLSFLDLGTPCSVAFTFGNNGPVTNTFGTNATICVWVSDLDQNTNALAYDTLTATLTSSRGDVEPLTLIETITNSGIFTTCIAATNLASFVGTNGVISAPVRVGADARLRGSE